MGILGGGLADLLACDMNKTPLQTSKIVSDFFPLLKPGGGWGTRVLGLLAHQERSKKCARLSPPLTASLPAAPPFSPPFISAGLVIMTMKHPGHSRDRSDAFVKLSEAFDVSGESFCCPPFLRFSRHS